MDTLIGVILGFLLAATIVVFVWQRRKPSREDASAIALKLEAPNPLSQIVPVEQKLSKPVELIFGATSNAPVLKVEAWGVAPVPTSARLIEPQSGGLMGLSSLLQAIPAVLTAAEFGNEQYMKVVVNGTLASATDGGFYPFVRGSDGHITDLARLNAPTQLGSLINAAAVWQIASTVVAQKHLADISKKLDDIKDAVGDVRRHQKDERRSKIEGGLTKMQEIAEAIGRGELTLAGRESLERIYDQLIQIRAHIQQDISNKVRGIEGVRGNDTIGTGDFVLKLSQHEEGLAELVDEWSYCVRALLMSWYVLSSYAGDPQTKAIRLKNIRASVDEFLTRQGGLNASQVRAEWDRKLIEVQAFFNWKSTLEERRTNLRNQVDATLGRLGATTVQLQQSGEEGARLLQSVDMPITLAVRVGVEGVVEAYEIEGLANSRTMPIDV
jgi:hypothetical protein